MKTKNALRNFCLIILFALYGCQEKIAPELASPAASTSPSTPSTVVPTVTDGVMRVTLESIDGMSPGFLNYQIHKANEGLSSPCEITNITSDPPNPVTSAKNITCFIESEEYTLWVKGLKFKVESTENACDFVNYQPYRFWQYQPGVSLTRFGDPRVLLQFECTEDALSSGAAVSGSGFGTIAPALTPATVCGQTFQVVQTTAAEPTFGSLNITAATPRVTTPESNNKLCTFDYSQEGVIPGGRAKPNCDEGRMTIYKVNLGFDAGVLTYKVDKAQDFRCGGNVTACFGGPLFKTDSLSATEITNGRRSKNYYTDGKTFSKEFTIEAPEKRNDYTNTYVANFTRQCSGVSGFRVWRDNTWNYDYQTDTPTQTLRHILNFGETISGGGVLLEAYNPAVLTEYTRLGASTSSTVDEVDNNGFTIVKIADDPMRGGLTFGTGALSKYFGGTEFTANPFYLFECRDKASDVRARIRLVVREWDRFYNSSLVSDFRYVSDIFKDVFIDPNGTIWNYSSRMDANNYQLFTGDPDALDGYNDIPDWDDFLQFSESDVSLGSCGAAVSPQMQDDPGAVLRFFNSRIPRTVRSRGWFLEDDM
jgi:hypothetical protein